MEYECCLLLVEMAGWLELSWWNMNAVSCLWRRLVELELSWWNMNAVSYWWKWLVGLELSWWNMNAVVAETTFEWRLGSFEIVQNM